MDGSGKASAGFGAKRRRFDVDEYYRMAEAGLLHRDDHIELIEGEIVEMSPIGSPHIGAAMALSRALTLAAERLGEFDEPEPDLVLLRPRTDGYRAKPSPSAAEALLVVEVADSSLAYDREVKRPLYARAGIAEYWIVDLAAGVIEVFRRCEHDGYAETMCRVRGEHVAPLSLPECRIAVADIVPDDAGPAPQ